MLHGEDSRGARTLTNDSKGEAEEAFIMDCSTILNNNNFNFRSNKVRSLHSTMALLLQLIFLCLQW